MRFLHEMTLDEALEEARQGEISMMLTADSPAPDLLVAVIILAKEIIRLRTIA